MFSTEKILHMRVFIPKSKLNSVTSALFEKGICQIKEADYKTKFTPEDESLNETRSQIESLVSDLSRYKSSIPKGSISSLFSTKEPLKTQVDDDSDRSILDNINQELYTLMPIVGDKIASIEEKKDKIEENKEIIRTLRLLPKDNTSLYSETGEIKTLVGLVSNKSRDKLSDSLKGTVFSLEKVDDKNSLIILVCLSKQYDDIHKILHSLGYESLKFPIKNKSPIQIIKELKSDNIKLKHAISQRKTALKEIAKKNSKKLELFSEQLDIISDKSFGLSKIGVSESFSLFECFVPVSNTEEFKSTIANYAQDHYIEVKKGKDSPTKFKNFSIFSPFEMITKLYSIPKYRRFDPTFFLAITFSIFFGFMLTDFVYGLLMAVFAIGVLRGGAKHDSSLKQFSAVLLWCGISTMIIGAAFGSYFGDFFQRLGFQVPMFLDSMKDIIPMMAIAVGLGIFHLFLGLMIGFIENLIQKKVRAAFLDQGVWILFVISVFLFPFQTTRMYGFILLGISILIQVSFKFVEGGPMISILSVFDYTGFLGDTFSYARLMALAIGTAGIALAVNFMTLMVAEIPWVGWIFAIVLFVLGHAFNLIMNGLGSFIHTLRLHFLEHFSKYYEGGGNLYEPFLAKRKKTHLEVEI